MLAYMKNGRFGNGSFPIGSLWRALRKKAEYGRIPYVAFFII